MVVAGFRALVSSIVRAQIGRSPVGEVVAVDAGEHGVVQIHVADRLGDSARLVLVHRSRAGRW